MREDQVLASDSHKAIPHQTFISCDEQGDWLYAVLPQAESYQSLGETEILGAQT